MRDDSKIQGSGEMVGESQPSGRVRQMPQASYVPQTIYCGQPNDVKKRYGKRIYDFCPECNKVAHLVRKCNQCGAEFSPGCYIRFKCADCWFSLLKTGD